MRAVTFLITLVMLSIHISAAGPTGVSDGGVVPERQTVGLVLSGGGAKGIAHIGFIQALEENDIPVDYVAGTSMGAIVGGLYSVGYTPADMMKLIESESFSYWSTGRINPSLVYFFDKEMPAPTLFSLPIGGHGRTAGILPKSLISPLPMNFAFMELFAPYTAQCRGDFNRLMVPFRCVASDETAKHKVVLSSGELGPAIRASMSFPIVFTPTEINGQLLYDGGIFDNFPVDVMREDFHPDIMIGVDVSTHTPDTIPDDPGSIVDQVEDLVIQRSDYSLPEAEGIKVHIDLQSFGLLDFTQAQRIYDIGYARGLEMVDSIRERVTARRSPEEMAARREKWRSDTPVVRFDSVSVTGGTPLQNAYISWIFDPHRRSAPEDTFGIAKARYSYYRAITAGRLADLRPTAVYDKDSGFFRLDLKTTVKPGVNVGIGGYITSSTNSYIYLSGGYSTLSFRSLSTKLSAWLGQSYLAGMIDASLNMRTSVPSAFTFRAVASRHKFYQNDYLFFEEKMPSFIINGEAFMRFGYSVACGHSARMDAAVGAGWLYDSFFRTNNDFIADMGRDHTRHALGQVRLSYEYNTLNNVTYPTTGSCLKAVAMGVMGHYCYRPALVESGYRSELFTPQPQRERCRWMQLEIEAAHYFTARRWGVGVDFDAVLSTRKLTGNYNATIVQAPAYHPTPSSYNAFNPAFHANSWMAASIKPYWLPFDNMALRSALCCFLPVRGIRENRVDYTPHYDGWFRPLRFFGEVSAVYTLPFATVSAWCNYQSYPANNWNVGLSFGVFILAPKFLR